MHRNDAGFGRLDVKYLRIDHHEVQIDVTTCLNTYIFNNQFDLHKNN